MSMLLPRTMIIPVWTGVVLGIFALFGAPLTTATGCLLVFAAAVPPAVMMLRSKAATLTLSEAIAAERRPCDRSRKGASERD